MKHIFEKGNADKPTFLLLHGTGGSELDLLPVAGMIDDEANVLSVRGNVNENGMARFFRRIAEGVFDEEDLVFRTKELYDFLSDAATEKGFDRDNMIAVGYSNGANIAGSLLFHHEKSLKGAVLFHPMVPRRGLEIPDLTDVPVFIGAGKNDPICKPEETEELAKLLEQAGANVEVYWESMGHQLTRTEVEQAARWYKENFS
ncbi:alpha/beta hydrolase [Salirhabdus salicampi]|uniref:alpha/beta hydrolase n=1 Tax=Salirhabdus salicampi TaxID=476102 RepID=UPI0020C41313|nr:alpha/beta hydrolase [Salirhabdus salicampi]MCP8616181.1 alpha/beta hydrolase [Salirhabdus salicampi]